MPLRSVNTIISQKRFFIILLFVCVSVYEVYKEKTSFDFAYDEHNVPALIVYTKEEKAHI